MGPVLPIIKLFVPLPFTNEELKTLDNIDRIKIYGSSREKATPRPLLKTIDDPDQVNTIIEQLRPYAHGWQSSGFYHSFTKRSPIEIYFYRNGQIETVFALSIGHRNGTPYIADYYDGNFLTEEEFKELMQILGLDEKLAYP